MHSLDTSFEGIEQRKIVKKKPSLHQLWPMYGAYRMFKDSKEGKPTILDDFRHEDPWITGSLLYYHLISFAVTVGYKH